MSLSSRHHYIPQFLIRGFKSPEGHYWVYDKLQDRIKRYPSSESIFFEWHRNTVEEGGIKYYNVEYIYSKIDSLCSPSIAELREGSIDTHLLNSDILAGLTAFVINIFWRVLKSDTVWNNFYDKAIFEIVDSNGNVIEDPNFLSFYKQSALLKLAHRAFMITDTVRKIKTLDDVIIIGLTQKPTLAGLIRVAYTHPKSLV